MNKKLKITGLLVVIVGFLSVAAWYLHRTNIPVLEPKGPVGLQERNLLYFGLALSLVVVIPVSSSSHGNTERATHRQNIARILIIAGLPKQYGG
jgi:heme/copper-type cytochrome/quinol oxidase subunit 2